jgi:hypothetical protein
VEEEEAGGSGSDFAMAEGRLGSVGGGLVVVAGRWDVEVVDKVTRRGAMEVEGRGDSEVEVEAMGVIPSSVLVDDGSFSSPAGATISVESVAAPDGDGMVRDRFDLIEGFSTCTAVSSLTSDIDDGIGGVLGSTSRFFTLNAVAASSSSRSRSFSCSLSAVRSRSRLAARCASTSRSLRAETSSSLLGREVGASTAGEEADEEVEDAGAESAGSEVDDPPARAEDLENQVLDLFFGSSAGREDGAGPGEDAADEDAPLAIRCSLQLAMLAERPARPEETEDEALTLLVEVVELVSFVGVSSRGRSPSLDVLRLNPAPLFLAPLPASAALSPSLSVLGTTALTTSSSAFSPPRPPPAGMPIRSSW